ncbi:MAG: hypothetical protein KF781_00665 [Chitinophagaceae bacterium]|nr:hypothetical protein [Chitinophagaceae bacterium]MCW5905246.1 hypothetical protein [Chitinophagaceae bacterium]
MKKITLIVAALFTTTFGFAQTNGKIKLEKGKKLMMESEVVTSTLISMMGQSIENKTNTNSTNKIVVEDVIGDTYKITNTPVKIKMTVEAMGETMEYDSEKPNATSELSKKLDESLNEPQTMMIDNQGKKISSKEDNAKKGTEDGEEEVDIRHAFIPIPENIKVGDKFEASDIDKDSNTSSSIKYTVRSIDGDIARLTFTGKIKSEGVTERQGMEVHTNTSGNINGECTVNINSGVIQTLKSKTRMRGNVSVMEQEMPIEIEITNKISIKEAE